MKKHVIWHRNNSHHKELIRITLGYILWNDEYYHTGGARTEDAYHEYLKKPDTISIEDFCVKCDLYYPGQFIEYQHSQSSIQWIKGFFFYKRTNNSSSPYAVGVMTDYDSWQKGNHVSVRTAYAIRPAKPIVRVPIGNQTLELTPEQLEKLKSIINNL